MRIIKFVHIKSYININTELKIKTCIYILLFID